MASTEWFPSTHAFQTTLRAVRANNPGVTISSDIEAGVLTFRNDSTRRWLGSTDQQGRVTTVRPRGLARTSRL